MAAAPHVNDSALGFTETVDDLCNAHQLISIYAATHVRDASRCRKPHTRSGATASWQQSSIARRRRFANKAQCCGRHALRSNSAATMTESALRHHVVHSVFADATAVSTRETLVGRAHHSERLGALRAT